jgi:hypothetical protein
MLPCAKTSFSIYMHVKVQSVHRMLQHYIHATKKHEVLQMLTRKNMTIMQDIMYHKWIPVVVHFSTPT